MRKLTYDAIVILAVLLLSACGGNSPSDETTTDGDAYSEVADQESADPMERADTEADTEADASENEQEVSEADSEANVGSETEDGDSGETDTDCRQSGDCYGTTPVCVGGRCRPSCTETGCTSGTCNPNNGRCEFCSSACGSGECCNLNSGLGWLCGTCCNPSCAEGETCLRTAAADDEGKCLAKSCPQACDGGARCDAEHGYVCYVPASDGDEETSEDPLAACSDSADTDMTSRVAIPKKGKASSCLAEHAQFALHHFADPRILSNYLVMTDYGKGLVAIDLTHPQRSPLKLPYQPDQMSFPRTGQVALIEDGKVSVYRESDFLAGGEPISTTDLGTMQGLLDGPRLLRSSFGSSCLTLRMDSLGEDGHITEGASRSYALGHYDVGGISTVGAGAIGFWTGTSDVVMGSLSCISHWNFYGLDVSGDGVLADAYKLFDGSLSIEESMGCSPATISALYNDDRLLAYSPASCSYSMSLSGSTCSSPSRFPIYRPRPDGKADYLGNLPIENTDLHIWDWQGDTVWESIDTTVKRYDFSDYATMQSPNTLELPTNPGGLTADGNYVYTILPGYGVAGFELAATGAASTLFSLNMMLPLTSAIDLFFANGLLWAQVNNTFYILDPANPDSAQPLATQTNQQAFYLLAQKNNQLIFGNNTNLEIYDVSTPASPRRVFAGTPLGAPAPTSASAKNADDTLAKYARLFGTTLYVGLSALSAIDLSDPSAPVTLWTLNKVTDADGNWDDNLYPVQVIGDKLIATFRNSNVSKNLGFVVLSTTATPPANPPITYRASGNSLGWVGSLAVIMNQTAAGTTLTTVDFSQPTAPVLVRTRERPDLLPQGTLIEKDGRLFVVNGDSNTLHLLDSTDPTTDEMSIPLPGRVSAFALRTVNGTREIAASTYSTGLEATTYSLGLYGLDGCGRR